MFTSIFSSVGVTHWRFLADASDTAFIRCSGFVKKQMYTTNCRYLSVVNQNTLLGISK